MKKRIKYNHIFPLNINSSFVESLFLIKDLYYFQLLKTLAGYVSFLLAMWD